MGISRPDAQTIDLLYSPITGKLDGNVENHYNNEFLVQQRCIDTQNCINFAYDNDNLLIQAGSLRLKRNSDNGLITGTTFDTNPLLTTNRTYNGFGEMASSTVDYNNNSLFQTQYTRDKLGRITQKSETINAITTIHDYSYDISGRLETVQRNGIETERYQYDSNGNRTHLNNQIIASYDAQDRLLNYQSNRYEYTDNGELTRKTKNGVSTAYSYDTLGNLTQVILPGDITIDYFTDAQNRRFGKQVNGQLIQGFLYKDQLNPIAELDQNNQIVSRFIYADKANVPAY